MTRKLVACKWCGVVYDKLRAGKFDECPTCDHTTEHMRAVPRVGLVHKWWNKVEA